MITKMTRKFLIWTLLEATLIIALNGAIMPPPWADPNLNPCAKEPRGWQLLYWPLDGQCYKIFQIGYPCPEGMELTPATGREGKELYAECKCPPKTALSSADGRCYQLFTAGPCKEGYYFGPDDVYKNDITRSTQQMGACKAIPVCASSNSIYWPKNGKCYQKLTRGPCAKGQLLTVDHQKIPICDCNKLRDMQLYRAIDNQCYQHFTRGPCKEHGHLFLPDRSCGCFSFLPHYHDESKKCFELGTLGPCAKGEMFSILPKTSIGGCVCQQDNIRYRNHTSCHRPFTQGPCRKNEILLNASTCIPQPCKRGQLYYPLTGRCYKIGTRGPCREGKILSFDFETRPSIDGISFNGVCSCEKRNCEAQIECDRSKGLIQYGKNCYKLYTQGPCSKGAWLAPRRGGKELLTDERINQGVCECAPNYVERTNNEIKECIPQTSIIAEFLNNSYAKE